MELNQAFACTGLRRDLRAFRASVMLGWRLASNWTSPVLFVLYSVVRPVSAAFILVFMYRAVTGSGVQPDRLALLVIGAAFWTFVQDGLDRFTEGVSDDRGRYRMLKYVYLAVPRLPIFLIGRAFALLGVALASVVVVIVVATPLLSLPVSLAAIDWPILLVAVAGGTVIVCALAIGLALLLLLLRDAYGYGAVIGQTLYIFSGAIFPISVLPPVLRFIAELSPLTYWLELVRRALLGPHAIRMFPDLGDAAVAGRMLAATLGLVVVAQLVLTWADRMARQRSLLDRETNF